MTDSDQTSINLEQVLGILRRHARWIALSLVLVGSAAFAFSEAQTKKYTATASLVFSNNQLGQQVAGLPVASTNNQQAQQNTNLKLVELGDMAEVTASRLGRGLTAGDVKSDVSASAQTESNIVTVAAAAPSPRLAANIANTYSEVFVAEQQSANHQYYASALALVNKQLASLSRRQRNGTAGLALQDRAQSLGVLAELRSGTVQVAQAATVPTSPSSPKVGRNTILGAVLGLLLGLGVAFLLERFDRRIREPEDLEEIYQLPLLGAIPESSALARSALANNHSSDRLPDSEAEAFQLIRAHLRYFNVDRELRTLLIASAGPGDGKTTVACHLAMSAAAAGRGSNVLLIEADLRRPTIAQQLAIRSGPGLSDVLIGTAELDVATQSIDLDSLSSRSSDGTLDVLVAGAMTPPNPAAMIESHAMEEVLEHAKSTYDLVVIDTAPLTAVSDAFPLLSRVDGVVIVGWVGRNRRDVAKRLHETLEGAGAPLLGVIANGFRSRGLGSYGYDYTYTQEEPDNTPTAPADDDRFWRLPGVGWATTGPLSNGGGSSTGNGHASRSAVAKRRASTKRTPSRDKPATAPKS